MLLAGTYALVVLMMISLIVATMVGAVTSVVDYMSEEKKRDRVFLAGAQNARYDPEDEDFAVGVKFAFLVLDPDTGQVRFHATTWSEKYPATNARAVCLKDTHSIPRHSSPAPDRDCVCGFYIALNTKALLRWVSIRRKCDCLLEVRASGRTIEHELGIRAERQDVLKVWLRPFCSDCGSRAELMGVMASKIKDSGDTRHISDLPSGSMWPLCSGCIALKADNLLATLTAANLAQMLQTEVEWA